MKTKHFFKILSLFLIISVNVNGQDLLKQLQKELPNTYHKTIGTFKSTRIGLGHSIETRKKGALQLSLYNRYWNKPTATSQRFLADEVTRRYGLDYAFTDKFTAGIGYTNFDKITDGFLKYKILKQQKNSKRAFASVTFLQAFSHRKSGRAIPNIFNDSKSSSDKYAFTSQILIARKINTEFSLQVAPTFIYREDNPATNNPNNQFALAFGGRHKISKHASIVSEYFYVANPLKSIDTYNTFMVGVNWELSHLLLQFHATNARNFAEDTFITQTRNNFNSKDGNFHFGFNATFVLHTRKKKLK